MFQLTKRGDYGVLAVYHIAQQPLGTFISIDEIATQSHIPRAFLSKILQDLCRGGILYSRRGFGGGFTLARSASHISLRDVVNSVEGKSSLVNCVGDSEQCPRMPQCLVAPFWNELQAIVDELLGSITVTDLIEPEKHYQMLRQLDQYRQQFHTPKPSA